jgi:hypothetical protein
MLYKSIILILPSQSMLSLTINTYIFSKEPLWFGIGFGEHSLKHYFLVLSFFGMFVY